MKREQRSDSVLNGLSLMGICLWYSVPLISALSGLRVLLVLVVIWVMSARPNVLARSILSIKWFVVWFAYLCFLLLAGVWSYGLISPQGFFQGVAMFALGSILIAYYELHSNDRLIERACWVSLIGWTVGSVISLAGLREYPLASRYLAGYDDGSGIDYAALGIGGFGFAYGSILVVVVCVRLVRALRGRRVLVLLLILALATVVGYVVASQYATALIALVLVGGLAGLGSRSRRVLVAEVLVVVLTALVLSAPLGRFLARQAVSLPETMVIREKLLDFSQGLLGSGFGDQSANRMGLYARSFEEFLGSPLLGQSLSLSGGSLGGHSAWADLLGAYGLIGALPLFVFLVTQGRQRVRRVGGASFGSAILLAYIYVGALGLLNPVIYLPELGFALFFILPAAASIVSRHECAGDWESDGARITYSPRDNQMRSHRGLLFCEWGIARA